ncbi:hypothetical protein GCM10022280_23060 [Sphingomonas swuensis]|uniref:RiboL-PSP-HEPN domain-containing protein n=1 Tax=Sphingomonas swuensis TaxID=977800 RepID=A0ABP7T8G0_9SPHN
MEDDRLKVGLRPDYAEALGLAIYCFANLEWKAVRCCERLEAGSLDLLSDRTAGRIADTLLHLVGAMPASPAQAALRKAARDFEFLVGTRNNLVHAKPGLAPDQSEALFRDGDQWTLGELESVADTFTACGAMFDEALSGILAA